METAALITPEYRLLQKRMHKSVERYGGGGAKDYKRVHRMAARNKCRSILDYGCGKGGMGLALQQGGYDVQFYEPAFEQWNHDPEPADMVVVRDVLEHVEPECLDAVLEHIRSKTKKLLWALIPHSESSDKLPDGRNAHLIVGPYSWWRDRLEKFFVIKGIRIRGPETEFVCVALASRQT